MSVKTAGVGHFQIPTAPAAGASVTSGASNVYTTSAVQLIASTVAALFITGIFVEEAAVSAGTYISVQLMIGTAGSETIIGQYLVGPSTGSTVTRTYRPIFPPIPVAASTRIAVKTADSVGAIARLVSLECIAQTNVVDDGIAQSANVLQWNSTNVAAPATAGIPEVNVKSINNVSTSAVTTVKPVVGLSIADTIATYSGNTPQTGDAFARIGAAGVGLTNLGDTRIANLDAAVSSRTKPADTQAAVTTVTTTTNLTNLPSIPANWLTAAGIAAGALNGKGDWNIGKTGYALSVAGIQAIWDALTSALTTVGSIGKLLVTNIDAAISSRSTYAGGAVASVTTAVTVGTNNDKTGYTLSAAGIQAVWDALTSALTTVGSIGKLLVTNIDALISSRSTYAGGDTSGTTTLLSRLTSGRATNLDNIDAAISSRLPTSGYTAPPSAASIRSEIDTNSTKLDAAVSTRLPTLSYVAPDNADILSIKAKTDNLPASPAATSDIPTALQNADALLKRDMSAIAGEALRSPLNALRMLRNKFSTTTTPGSIDVFKEDDTTLAFSKTVTTDPTAAPIVQG